MTDRERSTFSDVERESGVGVSLRGIDITKLRSDPFVPGERIADKYVVERVIGIGGVGIVLAAKHVELDELVAMKFLLPAMQSRPDIVGRFAKEAKAAVRIKSEYVARIFDVGFLPDRGPYFVMEFLDGQNLAEVLESRSLPLRRAVEFTLQVCEALAVAHSNGVIHRDIKPENLMLSRRSDGTDVMKVLDFGISKAALTAGSPPGGMELTQDLMGTPLYMSPEQIRSTANVDHRADIWSLGVVLYEMITQSVPFPGTTVPEICARVLETPAPALSLFVDAPPELQEVLDRCLQKDPTKRFQNVAELAIALLPFGPARGVLFAERTSTILQASGHISSVPFRFSSSPPPSDEANAISTLIPRAPALPRISQPRGLDSGSIKTLSVATQAKGSDVDLSDALTLETRKTRKAVVLAAAVVLVGVAGAAFAFARSSKASPEATFGATQIASTDASSGRALATTEPTMLPGSVTLSFEAKPVEAKLYLDDVAIGQNPFKQAFKRDGKSHTFRGEATGYVTRSVALNFDSDKEIVLALDKAEKSASFAALARGPSASPPSPHAGRPAAPKTPLPQDSQPPVPSAPAVASVVSAAPSSGMQEVELPKSKRPPRPVDTGRPW